MSATTDREHTPAAHATTTTEPLLVTEPIACHMLGLGRTSLFHLRSTGEIRSVLVKSRQSNVSGRRMYVVSSLHAYVQRLEAKAQAEAGTQMAPAVEKTRD